MFLEQSDNIFQIERVFKTFLTHFFEQKLN